MTDTNEQKDFIEPKEEVIEDEDVEELEEPKEPGEGEDEPDWKALAKTNIGIAKRRGTKLKKIKEQRAEAKELKEAKPSKEPEKPQDKKDFDLAEKSYLMGSGIKKNEIPFVWDEVSKTGKSIDELIESPYFQEKLEKEKSKEATPSGSKRSAGTVSNSVDYWIKKGQYPPDTPENTELRREVANALAKQTGDKSKFTPDPIV